MGSSAEALGNVTRLRARHPVTSQTREEHVLLASLGGTGDLQARLAELGLTHHAAGDVAAPRVPPATGDDWRSSAPSYHTAKGRAEGLALALGVAKPRAAHKLVAAL
jgi:hypothetical protein